MSTVLPAHPLQLPRLAEAKNVDDVLRNVDQIVDWAIDEQSHLGYFAVVYRRVTLTIRQAIDAGQFKDGTRVARLDVAFAQRYFNALNAYSYPSEYQGGLTLPWEVAFTGDQERKAIILQHLMSAFNAHISFDLGMACWEIAADSLETLENDFNRVNALLCSQMPGMVAVMQRLSPEMRWTRRLIPDELGVFDRMLTRLRKEAWSFAEYMARHPEKAERCQVHKLALTAATGSRYLQPPTQFGLLPALTHAIGRHESRNVADNIRAFEDLSKTPDKLDERYL
ncbi:DUF5995 family protein [Mycobacterium sp.]|uniref:DUF5995 family protein n=1 Tax=Mycobacterium sp. TaxID=1785 RepID=UPI002BA7B2CF|nr:DUF5995 family protein [Mycobacterium sp.]HTQ21214.1 DUF5995 family protein [Mycobacterium sp.]